MPPVRPYGKKGVAGTKSVDVRVLPETSEDAVDLATIRARLARPAGKTVPLEDVARRLGIKDIG